MTDLDVDELPIEVEQLVLSPRERERGYQVLRAQLCGRWSRGEYGPQCYVIASRIRGKDGPERSRLTVVLFALDTARILAAISLRGEELRDFGRAVAAAQSFLAGPARSGE